VRVGAQVVICCRNADCLHRALMALTPLIIRWGTYTSSDRLRAALLGMRA